MSQEEVGRLLAAVAGLRERAAMEIAYAAGLRLSEVLHLKLSDIDSERMILRVDQGKGKKDRNVMLSPALLETLRTYWKGSRPRVWLFPGQGGKRPLNPTVLQRAFKQAKQEARITKPVSFHSLRHTFATYLLESGVNVGRSRSCWATAAWARHNATPTLRATTCDRRAARWML